MQLNEQGLYDIYSLWHVPFWQRSSFWIIMVIPCLFLGAVLIMSIIRKKRTIRKQLPSWTVALNALNQLEVYAQAADSAHNELYTQLLVILKSYLDTRYGLQLSTKTDDELIDYLKQQAIAQTIIADMEKLCHGAVWVKYANRPLEASVLQERIKHAKVLVQQTIPRNQAAT